MVLQVIKEWVGKTGTTVKEGTVFDAANNPFRLSPDALIRAKIAKVIEESNTVKRKERLCANLQ